MHAPALQLGVRRAYLATICRSCYLWVLINWFCDWVVFYSTLIIISLYHSISHYSCTCISWFLSVLGLGFEVSSPRKFLQKRKKKTHTHTENSVLLEPWACRLPVTCFTLKKRAFVNILGKGENAGNQHFLLFSECLLPDQRQKFSLELYSIFLLQLLSVCQSQNFYRLAMS